PGLDARGERLGEFEADVAEAAGDQIDAALAQPSGLRRGLAEWRRGELLNPTAAVPVSHDWVGRLGSEFRGHALGGARRALRPVPDVDALAVEVRELLGQHLAGSEQRVLRGAQSVARRQRV